VWRVVERRREAPGVKDPVVTGRIEKPRTMNIPVGRSRAIVRAARCRSVVQIAMRERRLLAGDRYDGSGLLL